MSGSTPFDLLTAEDTPALEYAGSKDRDAPTLSTGLPLAPNSTSPTVTVVIAAYNAEKFIRPTIESVLAQCLKHVELIVVDDGSTDGTFGILSAFPDRRLTVISAGKSRRQRGEEYRPCRRARTLHFLSRRGRCPAAGFAAPHGPRAG